MNLQARNESLRQEEEARRRKTSAGDVIREGTGPMNAEREEEIPQETAEETEEEEAEEVTEMTEEETDMFEREDILLKILMIQETEDEERENTPMKTEAEEEEDIPQVTEKKESQVEAERRSMWLEKIHLTERLLQTIQNEEESTLPKISTLEITQLTEEEEDHLLEEKGLYTRTLIDQKLRIKDFKTNMIFSLLRLHSSTGKPHEYSRSQFNPKGFWGFGVLGFWGTSLISISIPNSC